MFIGFNLSREEMTDLLVLFTLFFLIFQESNDLSGKTSVVGIAPEMGK